MNAAVLLISVYYQFWPNIWVVFVIVLYEGMLGGAAYVNIFYLIRVEVCTLDLFILNMANHDQSRGFFFYLHYALFGTNVWGFLRSRLGSVKGSLRWLQQVLETV